MSLYNMLFGVNELAPVLLACLGTDAGKVPRFRDCYLDGDRIAIHTRTGGGNRDYYESLESCQDNYPDYFEEGKQSEWPSGPWNSNLRDLPGFLYDADDDYDCTYATFYFKFPDEYAEELKAISEKRQDAKPSEKWTILMEQLRCKQPPQP